MRGGHPGRVQDVTYTINSPAPTRLLLDGRQRRRCLRRGEAILSPEWTTASDVFLAPSAAEVRDGDYVVTDFVWHRVTGPTPRASRAKSPRAPSRVSPSPTTARAPAPADRRPAGRLVTSAGQRHPNAGLTPTGRRRMVPCLIDGG